MHASVTTDNARLPPGLWLIVVYYVIDFWIVTSDELESWMYHVLALPQTRLGGESPLSLIRDDLVDGYLAGIVLIIAVVIVVSGWRRYRIAVALVGLIAVAHCVPDMLVGLDISIRCDALVSDALAACPWPDADAYAWNGRHVAYHVLVLGLVLTMTVVGGKKYIRGRSTNESKAG